MGNKEVKQFGMIAGNYAEAFADAIIRVHDEVEFPKTWTSLTDLQADLGKKGGKAVEGLSGILILDYGLPSEDTEEEFSRFILIQNMFEANKELYGVRLFLYTQRLDLYQRLNEHFTEVPDSKYEGTSLHLCGGEYGVSSLVGIVTYPYVRIQKGARETAIRKEERKKFRKTVMNSRKFYNLSGRRTELLKLRSMIDKELEAINEEFSKHANELIQQDLDFIMQDFDAGLQLNEDVGIVEDEEVSPKFFS